MRFLWPRGHYFTLKAKVVGAFGAGKEMNNGCTYLREEMVEIVIGTDDLQNPAALAGDSRGAIDPGVLDRDAPFESPLEEGDPDRGCQRQNE